MVYLYRKNGGKVEGVSSDNTAYAVIDTTFYATVTDPSAPNGSDLGTPKIWDGSAIRNATGPEIATFATALATDTNLSFRALAKQRLQQDLILRKVLQALVAALLTEINTLRAQHSLAARTQTQAINAILANIDSGSFD